MNEQQKRIALIGGLLAVLILGVVLLRWPRSGDGSELGHGGPFESINYVDAIGSAASPATITSQYGNTTSTEMNSVGLPNVVFGGSYTPKSYGSQLFLLLERSLDGGTTYKPYAVLGPTTTSTIVYVDGASSTAGIPFIIPTGTGIATSGTAINFTFDLTLVADRIRIRAKESTTSTRGTLNLQAILSSN